MNRRAFFDHVTGIIGGCIAALVSIKVAPEVVEKLIPTPTDEAGYWLQIIEGPGKGQERAIVASTPTTLTLAGPQLPHHPDCRSCSVWILTKGGRGE